MLLELNIHNIISCKNNNIINNIYRELKDRVLDFGHGGVSRHLGQIADTLFEWEGPIAEGLGLTPADVAAIKVKHPYQLHLQTLVVSKHSSLLHQNLVRLLKLVL